MKTVALTGATGFVGKFALETLLAEGWQVQALTRTPQKPRNGVTWVTGSLTDKSALDELIQGVQVMAHIAGAVSARNRSRFFEVNVTGTANVIAAAKHNGVERIVHVSSLSARRPEVSDYAASKLMAENLYGGIPNVCILRPCAIYGEGDKATLPLIRQLLKNRAAIPGKPESRFSLIHGEDVGKVIAATVVSRVEGTLDISDGHDGYHWADLAAVTRRQFGTPRHMYYLPHPLARCLAAGSEFFAAMTGAIPQVTRGSIGQLYGGDWVVQDNGSPLLNHIGLEEGLLRTIEGYCKSGQMPRIERISSHTVANTESKTP